MSSQNTAANLVIFLTQRASHSYFGADTLCIWRNVELRMSKVTCTNNDKNGIGKKISGSYFVHVELASTFRPQAALTKSGTQDVGLLFFDS